MAFKDIYKYANSAFYVFSSRPNFYVVRKFYSKTYFPSKMKTAFFQNEELEDKCHIMISFEEESLNIKKVLNFQRNLSEKIEFFLSRLDVKLKEIIERRKVRAGCVPNINSVLLLDEQPFTNDAVLRECIRNSTGKLTLKILGSDYKVVVNGPTIVNLVLPTQMKVGFPTYPKTFTARCTDADKCSFVWFSSTPHKRKWTECGRGFHFTPTEKELGCILKLVCTPKNEFAEGPTVEVVSNYIVENAVQSQPIENRHKITVNKTGLQEFRIVSYNILSDTYTSTKEAKTYLFAYCDPGILELNYRLPLLHKELQGYNGDLYCLQEVDKKVFLNHFLPLFKPNGLDGVFCGKEKNSEGCALFYNKNKFTMLDCKQQIYFNEIESNPLLEDLKEKIKEEEGLWEKLSTLQTQIQIGTLNCKIIPNEIIVVGNTHLYFHPEADHIRLLQGIIGLKLLLDTVNNVKNQYPEKNVSIIFCGDFNSVPECGIYKLITEGFIESDYKDWMGNEGPKLKDVSFSHNVNMKSACGTPTYTNYTTIFKACIDYIFYQTDRLEVKQVVPMPSEDELSQEVAIPSHSFPSDHIALIADLKWKC